MGDLDIVCLEIGVGLSDPLNTEAFALFERKQESEDLDYRPGGGGGAHGAKKLLVVS